MFQHEVRPCERLIENISLRSLPFVGMGINRGTRHRTTTSFLSTVAPSRWINEIFNVHEEANNANNGIMVQIDSAGCKNLAMVSPTRTTVQTTLGSNEIPGTSKDRMIRPSCLCGFFSSPHVYRLGGCYGYVGDCRRDTRCSGIKVSSY